MAGVSQRAWRIPGQRTKRLAWGFTLTLNGKRTKAYRSEWTKEQAEEALAKALLKIEPPKPATEGVTLSAAVERYLAAIVAVARETGLRRGELLGLTWDRVDMTRGVIRLEMTKSGKRREVPMRQVVYNTLAALPGKHEGRVWRAGSIRTAFVNAVRE